MAQSKRRRQSEPVKTDEGCKPPESIQFAERIQPDGNPRLRGCEKIPKLHFYNFVFQRVTSEEIEFFTASEMSWRAVDVASAYTLRWLVEICQPYNLRKTQVIMTQWGRAIACYGRRLALPVIVPTWRHRLGSATADALAGRPADL